MKLDRGHFRNDMRLKSTDGKLEFRAFMRRSEDLPENFSVGLAFLRRMARAKSCLLRCNGPHGNTTIPSTPEHPHWNFHVHRASADLIDAGQRPEKAATVNRDFASYEEAVQYFLRTTNSPRSAAFPRPCAGEFPFAKTSQRHDGYGVTETAIQRSRGIPRAPARRLSRLLAPLFHEDGDMVDIFIDEIPKWIEPCEGQRPRHDADAVDLQLRSGHGEQAAHFNRHLAENRIPGTGRAAFHRGGTGAPLPGHSAVAQTVAPRIPACSSSSARSSRACSTEQLTEFIEERLGEYNPRTRVLPIADHDEYEVDYQFDAGPRPLYLFGIKDSDKARLTTICLPRVSRRRLPFKSVMVHQDFDSGITRKDRTRITSASDKQFTSLDDFRENGAEFLDRERAA